MGIRRTTKLQSNSEHNERGNWVTDDEGPKMKHDGWMMTDREVLVRDVRVRGGPVDYIRQLYTNTLRRNCSNLDCFIKHRQRHSGTDAATQSDMSGSAVVAPSVSTTDPWEDGEFEGV